MGPSLHFSGAKVRQNPDTAKHFSNFFLFFASFCDTFGVTAAITPCFANKEMQRSHELIRKQAAEADRTAPGLSYRMARKSRMAKIQKRTFGCSRNHTCCLPAAGRRCFLNPSEASPADRRPRRWRCQRAGCLRLYVSSSAGLHAIIFGSNQSYSLQSSFQTL